jgi:nicotinamide-nucleotide amidase
MKTAILTIGTEITLGQILNTNTHTLTQQLFPMGFEVLYHMTVPDERKVITESLQFLQKQVSLILVTGGLGPTVDDFTRDCISEFLNLKLQFSGDSWQRVQDKLKAYNVPVREVQKQQCYFPEGSRIFNNLKGTADGFCIESKGLRIYALPGPPKEIEALWQSAVLAELLQISEQLQKSLIHFWDVQNIGEGEISHLLKDEITHCPFTISFRVHRPYVELKLTYLEKASAEAKIWIEKISAKIAPFLRTKNN